MGNWIMAFLCAVFAVGIFGGLIAFAIIAIVGAISDNDKLRKLLIIICLIALIVGIVVLTPTFEGMMGSGKTNTNGYYNPASSHSCCICGDKAYRKYGTDYWCIDHYYMAKAADGDLTP